MSREIDDQFALANDGWRFLRGGRAAEEGAHAGDQFARTEGFGDVVVGAQLQADDAVGFG